MAEAVKGSSDRAFGLTFAVVFAVVAVWPWYFHGRAPYLWAAIVSVSLVAVSFVVPRILGPFNRIWLRFGLFLHHVVNPIIMALIYYGAVVPMGFLMKVAGRDLLRLKAAPEAESYWIRRDPPGPDPRSMPKQF